MGEFQWKLQACIENAGDVALRYLPGVVPIFILKGQGELCQQDSPLNPYTIQYLSQVLIMLTEKWIQKWLQSICIGGQS